MAGYKSLEIGPEEWSGSTHRRSAPLPTSHNQPDGNAQVGFGLEVMLLCWVSRGRLQFLLQNNAGQREEILPLTFSPSHCTHRETTLALTKPGPSRSSAETQFLQLTQPTRTFTFNCTEMLGRLSPRLQTFSVYLPPHLSLCKISTGKKLIQIFLLQSPRRQGNLMGCD